MRAGRRLAAVAVVVLALAACGDGDGDDGAAETTTTASSATSTTTAEPVESTAPTSTTTTVLGSAPSCGAWGSSPSAYDPSGGTYAVRLTDLDVAGRTVAFDVVQWLVGDDAVEAYQAAHPDHPEGPPNDYFVVNENPLVREAPVAAGVAVRLVRLAEDSDPDVDPATFEELPAYLASLPPGEGPYLSPSLFWLTVDNGVVTGICEQYVP